MLCSFGFILLCTKGLIFTFEPVEVNMHKHNAKFSSINSNIMAVDLLIKTVTASLLLTKWCKRATQQTVVSHVF